MFQFEINNVLKNNPNDRLLQENLPIIKKLLLELDKSAIPDKYIYNALNEILKKECPRNPEINYKNLFEIEMKRRYDELKITAKTHRQNKIKKSANFATWFCIS